MNNKHVLICEDDDGILDVVDIILQEKGYKVTMVKSGKDVDKSIAEINPDLVLIDLWMPEMNGDEVTKKLKSQKETKKIPVIIMSANKDIAKISEEVGAEGYLAKPFDISDLEDIVTKILG